MSASHVTFATSAPERRAPPSPRYAADPAVDADYLAFATRQHRGEPNGPSEYHDERRPLAGTHSRNAVYSAVSAAIVPCSTRSIRKPAASSALEVVRERPHREEELPPQLAVCVPAALVVEPVQIRLEAVVGPDELLGRGVDRLDRLVDDPASFREIGYADVPGLDERSAARDGAPRATSAACPRGRSRGGSRSSKRRRRRLGRAAAPRLPPARSGAAAPPSGSGSAGTRHARRRRACRARRGGTSATRRRSGSRRSALELGAAGARRGSRCRPSSRAGGRPNAVSPSGARLSGRDSGTSRDPGRCHT